MEAEELVAQVQGSLSIADKRDVLAEDLKRRNADPDLIAAVLDPENKHPDRKEPEVSLRDAKEVYRQLRVVGSRGRYKKNQLERVCLRVEKVLGPLGKLALVELKRAHGRKLQDVYRKERKADGAPLSPASIKRELNMLVAMVNFAIVEYDLEGKTKNPFVGLQIVDPEAPPESDGRKRDPLPDEVILSMPERMRNNSREPALTLIWALLEGTGCRVSEIAGLRVEDVRLVAERPHIWVQWHEERRVKTKVSIRAVLLVGNALLAAREAVKLAGGERMLFSRYAHEGGYEAVSQALMKHLRKVTTDKRHVLHSLRHNMKDWLVLAEVAERVELSDVSANGTD